jgi:hypothetical protein
MADNQRVIAILVEKLADLQRENRRLKQLNPSFQLRALGFCGADDSVSPERLLQESNKFSWVEWAVLFREEMQGTPRFASWAWVDQLARVNTAGGGKMLLAGHLCSSHVHEIFEGDAAFVKKLYYQYGFR